MKKGEKILVLTEGPNGTEWLPGEFLGKWNRPASFATDATPERGGPVVKVPGCIYREKTFKSIWEQVRKAD